MAQILSPKIVTDNLVLCLDPSQNKSLPTSTLPVKDGLVMWMDAADDSTFSFASPAQQTVTITIASPAVITLTSHGLSVGDKIYFTTTGALPTGITASAFYYVSVVDSANAFKISATLGGSNVNTSGTQSGTHYLYDTTQVSQWRDKSGSDYHMTPKSAGPVRRTALNSKKVLRFTTSQTIGNNTINLSASANTVFAVTRLTGTTNGRVLTCNLDASGNNWLLGHHGGTVNDYYAEGWIYDSATAADTTWRIFMGDWSGSSTDLANFYSNGTALATNSTQAVQGPNKIGINYYSNETCTCEAAEIIIYNRVLSSKERQLVHTYLGQKWGILNTDRSIMDLSGSENNGLFGNGTTANMPVIDFYNGKTLRFDASNDSVYFPINSSLNITNNISVECFININSFVSVGGIVTFGTTAGEQYALFTGASPTAVYLGTNWPNTWYQGATNTLTTNTWYHIVATFISGAWKMYVNGSLDTSGTFAISTFPTVSNAFLTLGVNHPGGAEYFDGKIGSVKIYNRVLSAAEVSQNYETLKSKFSTSIIQQGLVLNLDAGNPYSYSGSGSTWYDVSGSGYNATLVNSPTYVSDSIKYFSLSSSQNFTISNPLNQTATGQLWTVSAWVNIDTVTGANARYLISGLNLGISVEWYDVGPLIYLNSGANDYYSYGSNIEGSGWIMLTFIFRNSDGYRKIYNNLTDITTSGGPNNTSTPSGQSATFTIADNMRGKLASIMIYNRVLSTTEITQNYNATKSRFGL